jgi:hypothetical protein
MNAFLEIAERYAPQRKRQVRITKQQTDARDGALEERNTMVRAWARWRQQQVEEALTGPHGARVAELIEFLEKSPIDDAALVAFVRAGRWHDVDPDHRFLALRLIDGAIAEERERAGLSPFDDPPEGTSPFLEIRKLLR